MTTRETRSRGRVLSSVIAVAAAGLLLTACGGDGGAKTGVTPTSSPSATSSPLKPIKTPVDDASLGQALQRIVFSGHTPPGDGTACFVKAVDEQKLEQKAKDHLVALDTDDWAAATASLRTNVSETSADIFGSQALRSAFDSCVDDLLLETKSPSATASPSATPSAPTSTKGTPTTKPLPTMNPTSTASPSTPNLKPRYEQPEGEVIRSASQLEKGLVSTFSSFTNDSKQKKNYEKSGSCMAEVVFDVGFTQKSLLFLAGGPPLGTGAVADYLATPEDKALWDSQDFKSKLVSCTQAAGTTPTGDHGD